MKRYNSFLLWTLLFGWFLFIPLNALASYPISQDHTLAKINTLQHQQNSIDLVFVNAETADQPVIVTEPFVTHLTFYNNTVLTATDVVITYTLPTSVTYIAADAPDGVTILTDTVQLQVGLVSPHITHTVHVTHTVAPYYPIDQAVQFDFALSSAMTETNNVDNGRSTTITLAPSYPHASSWVGLPAESVAGTPYNTTFSVVDLYDNPTNLYTSTVILSSSDPQATFPTTTTFTSADNGLYTLPVSFATGGVQTIIATDIMNPALSQILTTTVIAGPVNATTAEMAVSGTPRADGVDVATIVVTTTDTFGNPIPQAEVWLNVTGSNNVLSAYPALTDQNGVATITLASTTPEAKALQVLLVKDHLNIWLPAQPLVTFTGATITGTTFIDSNEDGVYQSGSEGGLAGVQLSLYQAGELVKRTVTDANGRYTFSTLTAGTYQIEQSRLGEYRLTTPARATITVGSFATVADINFGNLDGALVTGVVYSDGNQDGTRQPEEPGIAGVTIASYNISNTLITTTTTGADGSYALDLPVDLPSAPPNFTFDSGRYELNDPATSVGNNFDFSVGRTYINGTQYKPLNFDFQTGRIPFTQTAYLPINHDFSVGRTYLPTTTYPSNYTFSNTNLISWTISNSSYVYVADNGANLDGPYLWIGRYSQSATTPPFVVPENAQTLRFDHQNYGRYSNSNGRLDIYAQYGEAFAQELYLGRVQSRGDQGWLEALLDIQALQGETIRLRFYTVNDSRNNDRVRIDNIQLIVQTPDWKPSYTSYNYTRVNGSGESGHLWIGRYGLSVTSPPFAVPENAQTLRFDHQNYGRYSNSNGRLNVYAQYGEEFAQELYLGRVQSRSDQGWLEALLDIQALQGETIRLRFYTIDDSNNNDRVRIDNIGLIIQTPDWKPSYTSYNYTRVNGSGESGHLWIGRYGLSVTSSPFVIPENAQTLRFDHQNYGRYSNSNGRLNVYAQYGEGFAQEVYLGRVQSRSEQGWLEALLDIQALQGQTVRLRFYTINDSNNNDRVRIDNIGLIIQTPDWKPSYTSYNYTRVNGSGESGHLWIGRYGLSVTSSPFVIPENAQTLRFDHQNYGRYSNSNGRLNVYAQYGEGFAQELYLGRVQSRSEQGWLEALLDIQALQGQTVRLRFYTIDDSNNNDRVRIDNIGFIIQTPEWTPSYTSYNYTRVIGEDDGHLWIGRYGLSVTSNPFVIPNDAQTLRFDHQNYGRYSNSNGRLNVYAQYGEAFSQELYLGRVQSQSQQGWRVASLNIQALQGETVRLRFYTINDSNNNDRVRIDNVYVLPAPTQPYTITEINLPNYTSTTPDEIGFTMTGGGSYVADYGDFSVDAFNSTVTVAPDLLVADGISTAVVTVTLRDVLSQTMAGFDVEVNATGNNVFVTQPVSPTNEAGQVTAVITATSAPQTVLITARTIDGNVVLAEAVNLAIIPGVTDANTSTFVASPEYVVSNGVATADFTVTLRDQFNNLIAGRPVTISHDGTAINITYAMTQTNSAGQLTGSFASAVAQPATFTAMADGVVLAQTPVITFTSADPFLSTVEVSPSVQIADGLTPIQLTITVRDQFNNPLPDKPVDLAVAGTVNVNGQPVTTTVEIGISGPDGVVVADLTSLTVGANHLTLYADNILIASQPVVTFTVGPVDSSVSTVTANRTTIIADGTDSSLVTVTLYDSYNHPLAGHAIEILATPPLTITPVITQTDINGVWTAWVRGDTVQTSLLTAVDQTANITLSQQISLTFVAGSIDQSTSTVVVSPTAVLADGTTLITVSGILRDAQNHLTSNRAIRLTASNGTIISPTNQITTDENGGFLFVLRNNHVGDSTLRLYDQVYVGTSLNLGVVQFFAGSVDPSASTFVSNKTTLIADGADTATLTATLYDSYGHPLPQETVLIQSSNTGISLTQTLTQTDSNGQIVATVQGTTVQTLTLTAVYQPTQGNPISLPQTIDLTFMAGTPHAGNSAITVAPQTVFVNQLVTVTATLQDALGHPVANRAMQLQVTGTGNTLTPTNPLMTDELGQLTVQLTSSSAETKTLTLEDITTGHLLVVGDVTFLAGEIDAMRSQLSADRTNLYADGIDTAVVTARILDANYNPIPNVEVTLRSDGTNVTLTPLATTTDADGRLQATLSTLTPQMVTVQAILPQEGITLTRELVLTFFSPPPDLTQSTITVSPTLAIANGGESVTVQATLRDRNGAPVANQAIKLIASGSRNSIFPVSQYNTDENGQIIFFVNSTKAESKSLTLRHVASGVDLSLGTVQFVGGTPSDTRSRLEIVGEDRILADGQAYGVVRLTLYDRFGNAVPNQTAVLSTTAPVTLTQLALQTDSNGQLLARVSSGQIALAEITAQAGAVTVLDTAEISFITADLNVTKENALFAYAGFPFTYTLTIENVGLAPAEGVVFTDTLPSQMSFASQDSALPFTMSQSDLTWQVGDLDIGEVVQVTLIVTPDETLLDGTLVTNYLTATTQTDDLFVDNNVASVTHLVNEPAPELLLSPGLPSLDIPFGGRGEFLMDVKNIGLLVMTDTVIAPSAPQVMPWLTITPNTIASIEPRQQQSISVTAVLSEAVHPGYYRDFIIATDASGDEQRAVLTVYHQPETRSVQVTVDNDQGVAVQNAYVALLLPDALIDKTPAFTNYADVARNGRSATDGTLTFANIPTGVYQYTISAHNHETATGVMTVTTGNGYQLESVTLVAQPLLSVNPLSPEMTVAPNDTNSIQLEVTNNGAAPLTGVTIQTPSNYPWIYLGIPATLPTLQPDETFSFSVFANPPVTANVDIYNEYLTIQSGDQQQLVALTINVTPQNTRDIDIVIESDLDTSLLPEAKVTLVRQEQSIQLVQGITRTYNLQFFALTDNAGVAQFTDLPLGTYNYMVEKAGYKRDTGTITVEALIETSQGNAPISNRNYLAKMEAQTDPLSRFLISLRPAPFRASWSVDPVTQEYEIELTITRNNESEDSQPLELLIPDREWEFSSCEEGSLTDPIPVYNITTTPISVTQVIFSDDSISWPGGPVVVGSNQVGIIEATAPAPIEGDITFAISMTYYSVYSQTVAYTFNPSSLTLHNPRNVEQTYVINPTQWDANATYTIDITQPQGDLSWLTLTAVETQDITLSAGTELEVTLTGVVPRSLAVATYRDVVTLKMTDSNGYAREGYLDLEVTRDAFGNVQLHTAYRLGSVPHEQLFISTEGVIHSSCGSGSGNGNGNSDGGRGGSAGGWVWSIAVDDEGNGSLSGQNEEGNPPFSNAFGPPVQITGDATQEVRMQLSQNVMLEGEGFVANLRLDSRTGGTVSDIEVDIEIRERWTGTLANNRFTIDPTSPTSLGTLGSGSFVSQDWLIVPNNDNSVGEYTVRAVVSYTFDGVQRTFSTRYERMSVVPAPNLVITYELPGVDPNIICTDFDLRATLHNIGEGPARSVRITSGEPIITNPDGTQQGFAILETRVNGSRYNNDSMGVDIGTIGSGESVEVVWRMQPGSPGRFLEFSSDYRMLNTEDELLQPRISAINTFITPDFAYGCFTTDPGPGSPDLVVDILTELDGTPTEEPVDIEVEVTNLGGSITEDFYVRFAFYTLELSEEEQNGQLVHVARWVEAGDPIEVLVTDNLGHNASTIVEATFTPPVFANYQLVVTVDPAD